MSDVTITIEGQKFSGWTSFDIARSIESLTGSFSMTVTDDVNQKSNLDWPLQTQKAVQIKVDDELLITGFIDKVNTVINAFTHSITISGRDKTADLVDCSADLVAQKFSFNRTNILQLAEALANPFGIKVEVQDGTDVSKIFKLSLNTGETIFELLDRKAKELGIILTTNTRGSLVLGNSQREISTSTLRLGDNIKEGTADFDYKNRYSDYKVIGQSKESKDWRANINIKAVSSDEGVIRFRPLLIQASGEINAARAQLLANWEANVRAARSQSIEVVVQGFFQENGNIWDINKLVQIFAPALYVNPPTKMLITGIVYILNNEGSSTRLTLKREDAFEVDPRSIVKAKKEIGFKTVTVAEAQ